LRDFLFSVMGGYITLCRKNKLPFGIESSYTLEDVFSTVVCVLLTYLKDVTYFPDSALYNNTFPDYFKHSKQNCNDVMLQSYSLR